jgi:hypothetical protein
VTFGTDVIGAVGRPLVVLDPDGVELGTLSGFIRGTADRDEEGGFAVSDALGVVLTAARTAAGIEEIRRMYRLRDVGGEEYVVEAVRFAYGPGGGRIEKFALSGQR